MFLVVDIELIVADTESVAVDIEQAAISDGLPSIPVAKYIPVLD